MRRLVAISLFLTLCHLAMAQAFMRKVPNLDFANFADNRIDFYGDSADFEHFFAKMDTLLFYGEGCVNIMHIGGSHVQAGVFTQLLRDNLLSLDPGLNRGLGSAFPFSAGKTNNPSGYRVSSTGEWSYCRNAVAFDKRLGLCGAAVTTCDSSATITLTTIERYGCDVNQSFTFNRITLTGYSDCDSIPTIPVVAACDTVIFPTVDTVNETYYYTLPQRSDTVTIMFDTLCGNFTITGLWLDDDSGIGLICHGVGVNGARVVSYLSCLDFARDLDKVQPDLVIFGIGVNDAAADDFSPTAFIRDYSQLISIIKQKYPHCALLFITNNDTYKKVRRNNYRCNANGETAEQAFIDLGRRHNAGVWDQFHIMGGLGSMKLWQNEKLAQNDKIHFTQKGYAILGDLLYNALIEKYVNHLREVGGKK